MTRKKTFAPSPGPFTVYVPDRPETQLQIRDAHTRIIAVSSRYGEHFGAFEISTEERAANMAMMAASSQMFDALGLIEQALTNPNNAGALASAFAAVRDARRAAMTIAKPKKAG
jgi:hypothetical protein